MPFVGLLACEIPKPKAQLHGSLQAKPETAGGPRPYVKSTVSGLGMFRPKP